MHQQRASQKLSHAFQSDIKQPFICSRYTILATNSATLAAPLRLIPSDINGSVIRLKPFSLSVYQDALHQGNDSDDATKDVSLRETHSEEGRCAFVDVCREI